MNWMIGLAVQSIILVAGLGIVIETLQGHAVESILIRTSLLVLLYGGMIFLLLLGLPRLLAHLEKGK